MKRFARTGVTLATVLALSGCGAKGAKVMNTMSFGAVAEFFSLLKGDYAPGQTVTADVYGPVPGADAEIFCREVGETCSVRIIEENGARMYETPNQGPNSVTEGCVEVYGSHKLFRLETSDNTIELKVKTSGECNPEEYQASSTSTSGS